MRSPRERSARGTSRLLLYPAYYCVVNGAIALLIVARRAALRSGALALEYPPHRAV